MISRLVFLMRKSAWLLALLMLAVAFSAQAQDQEDDGPFVYQLTEDGTGYIIYPDRSVMDWGRGDVTFLEVPATRPCDGLPIVGVDGFDNCKYLMDIVFESSTNVKYIGSFKGCTSLFLITSPEGDNMLPSSV